MPLGGNSGPYPKLKRPFGPLKIFPAHMPTRFDVGIQNFLERSSGKEVNETQKENKESERGKFILPLSSNSGGT